MKKINSFIVVMKLKCCVPVCPLAVFCNFAQFILFHSGFKLKKKFVVNDSFLRGSTECQYLQCIYLYSAFIAFFVTGRFLQVIHLVSKETFTFRTG